MEKDRKLLSINQLLKYKQQIRQEYVERRNRILLLKAQTSIIVNKHKTNIKRQATIHKIKSEVASLQNTVMPLLDQENQTTTKSFTQ